MTVKLGSLVNVLIKPHDAGDFGGAVGVVTRVHSYTTVQVHGSFPLPAGAAPRSVSVAIVNYRLISDDDDEHGRRVTSAQVFANRDDAYAFIGQGIKAAVDTVLSTGKELASIPDGRHNGLVAFES